MLEDTNSLDGAQIMVQYKVVETGYVMVERMSHVLRNIHLGITMNRLIY